MMRRFPLLLLLACFVSSQVVMAQQPIDFAVRVTATVSETPAPSITLKWDAHKDQKTVGIQRKLKSDANFPATTMATLDSTATTWTDNTVEVGKSYEYRLIRDIVQPAGKDSATGQQLYRRWWGFGYINSGIKVTPTLRGRVLVLVDTTMKGALADVLARWTTDAINEGWAVSMRYVQRAEAFDPAAVSTVREVIDAEIASGGALKCLFLVGRVPVPYSGVIAPDGHSDHVGAWPADGVYGSLQSFYTDASANYPNNSRPPQNNVPGDGKFDQSTFSGVVEVAVGRVDFFNLPAFGKSETDLLKAYFDKDHAFRTGQVPVVVGGIIDDNFGSYGEGFAASPWRSFQLFGTDTAVKAADWFESLAGPSTYLWAYGCGGGTDVSCGGVCTTAELATKPVNAVHTQLFGSYFGDWNTKNNLLRSAIATSPTALTCGWVARPAWYTHHMALGETIGYSLLISENNRSVVGQSLGTYLPNVVYSSQGASVASTGERGVHMALVGDPTLRAFMQPVPGVLVARATTEFPNRVNVSWDPVAGANGYMVARKLPGQDAQMLTASPITQTSLRDSLVNEGQVKYQVYACSIRTSASGSYYDMGKPAEATVLTTDVAEFVQPLHATVSVSPQPATTAATLNLSSDTEIVTMVMTISDLNGVTIHSESVGSRSAGNHQVALPVELLASGHYIVTLHTPGGMFTAPLVVVH